MKIRLIFVIVIILIVSLNADLAQLKPLQLDIKVVVMQMVVFGKAIF